MPLRRTLSEGTLSPDTRAGIAGQLLSGKIGEQALSVVRVRGASALVVLAGPAGGAAPGEPDRDVPQAERTGELDDVEDQLFRFSRIVDASPDLSVILDDPTADPDARSALVDRLLAGRAHPLVTELVDALARDTAGRSFTHGVRELVDQAAQRRQKIVAIVKTAVPLTAEQTGPVGRLARPDLRPRGLGARRGRTARCSAGSGCRSATR